MRINKIAVEVKKLDIVDVVSSYLDLKRQGRDHMALCPFHADKSLGSFRVNSLRNCYKCFSCNEGGNAIKFVSSFLNISYEAAVLRIAVEHGVISQSALSQLEENEDAVIEIRELPEREERGVITTSTSPEVLDKVYRTFLSFLPLSQEHADYLANRNVQGDFYSISPCTTGIMLPFLTKLGKRHLDLLRDVPGFFTHDCLAYDCVDEEGDFSVYLYQYRSVKGIILPVKNIHGQIVGLQIRKDRVKSKADARYIWFSSSWAQGEEGYIGGVSVGAPIHVEYPLEVVYPKVLFLTEGIFKAKAVAQTFGAICFSQQGINAQDGLITCLQELSKKNPIEHIYLAYDMDMMENVQVFLQLERAVKKLRGMNNNLYLYVVTWDINKGKGIDDAINQKAEFEKSEWDIFAKKYKKTFARELKTFKEKTQKKVSANG